MTRPFLDYYRTHEISPVNQDLSDLGRHLERRESLYLSLGVVPAFVTGRSVIEFGPGSGHNSIYTSTLRPRRYILVDGNPSGLRGTRDVLDRFAPEPEACVLVESLIEAYASDERFDLVLCEGTIPTQMDPSAFCRRVAGFTAEGGILIVTTQGSATSLGELLRRVVAAQLVSRTASVSDQLAVLTPYFAPHTATMLGMSRSVEDWVLDNIIQPFVGNLYSPAQAIDDLRTDGFQVYNASPKFFTVWRWYKRLVGADRDIGPTVQSEYFANLLNLMDYRLEGGAKHSADVGEHISVLADTFYKTLTRVEIENASYGPVFEQLREIADAIRPVSSTTAASIDEALAVCDAARDGSELPHTPAFTSFFGHGQQYLSFVRSTSRPS